MAGIVGYGAYVPIYRIKVEEIAKVWREDADAIKKGLNIKEKAFLEGMRMLQQ
jgi:hydroxymethylglutaryl-CoA synthase